jgi:predicted nucleic acid-binding protein
MRVVLDTSSIVSALIAPAGKSAALQRHADGPSAWIRKRYPDPEFGNV